MLENAVGRGRGAEGISSPKKWREKGMSTVCSGNHSQKSESV